MTTKRVGGCSTRVGRWRERLAQDPPEEGKLVQEFEDSAIAGWQKFLQLIVRVLQAQQGVEVELVGPHVENDIGDTSTFSIKGGLRFKQGRPIKLLQKYGKQPLTFSALITNGKLIEPIEIAPT